MQLERQKCAYPGAAALLFRKTYPGQELLKTAPAGFNVQAAIGRKQFHRLVEGDRLLAFQLLPILKADRQFGPHRQRMLL